MIKILIIDDSALVRETLKNIIETDPQLTVVSTSSSPSIAIKKLDFLKPHVLIINIDNNEKGLEFIKEIKEKYNIPIILISSTISKSSSLGNLTIQSGVFDIVSSQGKNLKSFIEKSSNIICEIIKKTVKDKNTQNTISTKNKRNITETKRIIEPKLTADAMLSLGKLSDNIVKTDKIIVIGASTGGTEALCVLLEALPADSPGIVIVQHMPEKFTKSFAERLDSLCKMNVTEAQNNDIVSRGKVLIAPGGKHTLLKRTGTNYFVEVKDGPLVSRHKPSVDVLFRSTAKYAGKNAIGVIMTGMGDDGAKGLLEMHQSGAYTIAQNEASCIVFGMPNEAIKLNGVDTVLPLSKIAYEIINKTKTSQK